MRMIELLKFCELFLVFMSGVMLLVMLVMNRIGQFVLLVNGLLNCYLGWIVCLVYDIWKSMLIVFVVLFIFCRVLVYFLNLMVVFVNGFVLEYMIVGNVLFVFLNKVFRGIVGGIGFWLQVFGRVLVVGFMMFRYVRLLFFFKVVKVFVNGLNFWMGWYSVVEMNF